MIGIDEHARLYYEGSPSGGAIALWPPPFFSIATVIAGSDRLQNVPSEFNLALTPMIFREDQFDPVTRVRRGRFYNASDGARSQQWRVYPHPAMPTEARKVASDGFVGKHLITFYDWAAGANLLGSSHSVFVALGTQGVMTLLRVISVEKISTGEDLVTLKARSNMGVLPEIAEERLPDAHRKSIMQFSTNVVDTAYRGGPESVIDRCRDMAAAVLGAFLGAPEKDLAKLAAMSREQSKNLMAHAAHILALLHARTKPTEQAKRGVQHPKEEDAALALECAGTILRESGWARP